MEPKDDGFVEVDLGKSSEVASETVSPTKAEEVSEPGRRELNKSIEDLEAAISELFPDEPLESLGLFQRLSIDNLEIQKQLLISKLNEKIVQLYTELDELRSERVDISPKSPKYLSVNANIKEKEDLLGQLMAKKLPGLDFAVAAKRAAAAAAEVAVASAAAPEVVPTPASIPMRFANMIINGARGIGRQFMQWAGDVRARVFPASSRGSSPSPQPNAMPLPGQSLEKDKIESEWGSDVANLIKIYNGILGKNDENEESVRVKLNSALEKALKSKLFYDLNREEYKKDFMNLIKGAYPAVHAALKQPNDGNQNSRRSEMRFSNSLSSQQSLSSLVLPEKKAKEKPEKAEPSTKKYN
jgi:hypothetical protein